MIYKSAILTVLFAAALHSQTAAARSLRPVAAADREAFDRSRKIALLVGVGTYPVYSGIGRLSYTAADVQNLGEQLKSQGYTVIPLVDGEATRESVRGALRNIRKVLDQKEATLIFYFSGHGWAPSGRNMLATFDAGSSDLAGSGLALDEVLTMMAETGARRRIAWIDACRNEPGKSAGTNRSFAAMDRAEGTRVLFSTRAGELSFESSELQQGVFTHFLIRALRGEAARPDGIITFRDVADFVSEGLQEWGLKKGGLQIPYESGEASGDFLLARRIALRLPEPSPQQPSDPGPEVQSSGLATLRRLQQAVGGVTNLTAVKDITQRTELNLVAVPGLNATQVIQVMAPQIRYSITLASGVDVVAYSDGKGGGWFKGTKAPTPLVPEIRRQLSGELFRMPVLLWLSDRVSGREIRAISPHVIEISESKEQWVKLHLDPATALVTKAEYNDPEGKHVEAAFEDWRDVGRIKLPHKFYLKQGGKIVSEGSVTEYKVNQSLTAENLSRVP